MHHVFIWEGFDIPKEKWELRMQEQQVSWHGFMLRHMYLQPSPTQPRYTASKGQCISFLWTCARNAFRKFLPSQQQTQQVKMINLPNETLKLQPKSFWRSQVPSEHWSGDMRLVLEIQLKTIRNQTKKIPTWSSALKLSLVLQLPSLLCSIGPGCEAEFFDKELHESNYCKHKDAIPVDGRNSCTSWGW